ncbi:MAG TPA: phosphoesterase, partial [bacterium]|nr:phosphoesterase [bacterium]
RRAAKFGIPSVYLRTYADFMGAPPGWTWHESIEVDGVTYSHGEGFSGPLGALKCAQANMGPVVIGHLHSYAGVLFNANPKFLFWGLNAGCLIDRHAYAFAYAKNSPAKPILGCGVVRGGVPTFVPMNLDKAGRWTGGL